MVPRIEAVIVDVLTGDEPSVTGAWLDKLVAFRAGQVVSFGLAGVTIVTVVTVAPIEIVRV